jgi:DNA-binding MarR family transcriptional regulator
MAEQTALPTIDRRYRRGVLTWLHLTRVQSRIARQERALLADFGLTVAQFDVLSRLATEPGLSQQALAKRLVVTKGNVCGLIDRLEASGLVERSQDPNDRRSYKLHLTTQGHDLFWQVAPTLEATIASQFDALSDDDQAALLTLIARLDRSLTDSE